MNNILNTLPINIKQNIHKTVGQIAAQPETKVFLS
ncbi:hypothetical protein Anacy_1737 [Anabaena cylindrica PCC 7122]|uniref:Uncharacterized protein n=1 Tax=Anabaena cylindrica (strain ATCC 27899 / PCC 7122) TaxID=272123 RepID=K9ZDJ4_ANACC|nr:hypothetical protein Anacy_1737 [Anabaena cylindrica PCC 7122]BAY05794.1 hypothetical protein NIES19_50710 [Anabaena cylindrica PCC 7122]